MKAAYERIQAIGREAYIEERAERRASKPATAAFAERAARAIESLNDEGLWTSAPTDEEQGFLRAKGLDENPTLIRSRDFCQNAGVLLDYHDALLREQEEAP